MLFLEKLLASGKEFGLKFVHNVKDGSEKVVSYAVRFHLLIFY